MATRKRDRAVERVPDGIFPADPDAQLDPGALHKFLLHRAPLTAAQSRALVVEANKRTRRAAAAREKQHRELTKTLIRLNVAQKKRDYAAGMELAQRAGELWNQQQRAALEPIINMVEAARDRAMGHQLGGAHNEEQQREAARRARPYVRRAAELRAKRKGWELSDIIAELRRHPPQRGQPPLSARTIRRYLNRHGVA